MGRTRMGWRTGIVISVECLMDPLDPKPESKESAGEQEPGAAGSPMVEGETAILVFEHPVRLWIYAMIAGSLAGLAAWLGGEAIHRWFADVHAQQIELSQVGEIAKPFPSAESREATLAFGLLGSCVR